MIDIDDLSGSTTRTGTHGDRVLKQLVTRVTSALRPSTWCPDGGDEFAVVMPETDLDEAQQIADRLRRRIGDTPVEGVAVTVSIGAAACRGRAGGSYEVVAPASRRAHCGGADADRYSDAFDWRVADSTAQASAICCASSRSVSGITTANSSPPIRATRSDGRKADVTRVTSCFSTRSPVVCRSRR